MSDKLPQQPLNEEVDLGQLFSAIGKLFERLFKFIGKIFKSIFSFFIYALKPIVNNFKVVAIGLAIAAIVGYFVEKNNKPVYISNMVVNPYFDSKFELTNDIAYFNSLIGTNNLKILSEIFEIDTLSAKNLLGFKVELGPETQNDVLKEYDEYMKSIDSIYAKDITYDKYLKNRDIYSGSTFKITAKSRNNYIFSSLEKGIIKTLENKHSKKLQKRADSIYNVKKEAYVKELDRVEKLQNLYFEVKKSEVNNGPVTLNSGSLLPVSQEKTSTKEFELFQEEVKIRNSLRYLEEDRFEEKDLYDVVSSFTAIGSKEDKLSKRYSLVFPFAIFVLIILMYYTFKAFNYIKEYE